MLKFLLKIFLIAFILFALGKYASYLMTGQPPTVDIKAPVIPDINISEITEGLSEAISKKIKLVKEEVNESKNEDNTIYKWRDNNGVLYYTSEQPPDDVNYESISYNKETNVVPAINTATNKTNTQDNKSTSSPKSLSTDFPENVYSPKGIEHLFNQAKDIQNLVNDQFSNQDNISNQE